MRFWLSLACALTLAGCAAPREFHLQETFDSAEAAALMAPGKNTISGSALMRQQSGGVVTCAGQPVYLIPSTTYARARMQAIYGAGHFVGAYRGAKFTPEIPAYLSTMRQSTCNAQGFFKFDNVANGDFFLQTTIHWSLGAYYPIQGGGLYAPISTRDGQSVDITLAP